MIFPNQLATGNHGSACTGFTWVTCPAASVPSPTIRECSTTTSSTQHTRTRSTASSRSAGTTLRCTAIGAVDVTGGPPSVLPSMVDLHQPLRGIRCGDPQHPRPKGLGRSRDPDESRPWFPWPPDGPRSALQAGRGDALHDVPLRDG